MKNDRGEQRVRREKKSKTMIWRKKERMTERKEKMRGKREKLCTHIYKQMEHELLLYSISRLKESKSLKTGRCKHVGINKEYCHFIIIDIFFFGERVCVILQYASLKPCAWFSFMVQENTFAWYWEKPHQGYVSISIKHLVGFHVAWCNPTDFVNITELKNKNEIYIYNKRVVRKHVMIIWHETALTVDTKRRQTSYVRSSHRTFQWMKYSIQADPFSFPFLCNPYTSNWILFRVLNRPN